MTLFVKIVAGFIGVAIIGCVVHASIMASGGYDLSSSPLLIALGFGLAIGSICVGVAWSDGRRLLAVVLGVALLAGELYALIQTAERTIAHRDAQAAPRRDAEKKREKAQARVDQALKALAAARLDSPRLKTALEAKSTADNAVVLKSAERGCAKNCRELLQEQVSNAAAEVQAARDEMARDEAAAAAEVKAARDAVSSLPDPVSAAPLADRLGVAAWEIDLAAAALASVAANGLGAALVAFAAHGVAIRQRRPARTRNAAETVVPLEPTPLQPEPEPTPSISAPAVRQLPKPTKRNPGAEADLFARKTLRPDAGGRVYVRELRDMYHAWCRAEGKEPLPDSEIGAALSALFASVGLEVTGRGNNPSFVGIAWREDVTPTLDNALRSRPNVALAM